MPQLQRTYFSAIAAFVVYAAWVSRCFCYLFADTSAMSTSLPLWCVGWLIRCPSHPPFEKLGSTLVSNSSGCGLGDTWGGEGEYFLIAMTNILLRRLYVSPLNYKLKVSCHFLILSSTTYYVASACRNENRVNSIAPTLTGTNYRACLTQSSITKTQHDSRSKFLFGNCWIQ